MSLANPASTNHFVDIFTLAEDEENKSIDCIDKLLSHSILCSNHLLLILDKNYEKTVLFVGEKSTGKSSILALLKGSSKDEAPKPTYAMDYSYAKRSTSARKEVVHFYELGGGRLLNSLVNIPLTRENYKNFSYVIVLDLSDPGSLIDNLLFWIQSIKQSTENFFKELRETSPNEVESYLKTCLSTYEQHEDKMKIKPIMIPTIVLGNKYDAYESFEAENRKWISRILRYFCHVNGCSLFFSSIVNPKLSQQIRTLLNNFFFANNLPQLMQKDYTKQIFMSFGSDSIESMGIQTTGNLTMQEMLKKTAREMFPPKNKNDKESNVQFNVNQYPESKIDATKREKNIDREKAAKAFLSQKNISQGGVNLKSDPDTGKSTSRKGDQIDYESIGQARKARNNTTINQNFPQVEIIAKSGPKRDIISDKGNLGEKIEDQVFSNKILMDHNPENPRVNQVNVKKFRPTNRITNQIEQQEYTNGIIQLSQE